MSVLRTYDYTIFSSHLDSTVFSPQSVKRVSFHSFLYIFYLISSCSAASCSCIISSLISYLPIINFNTILTPLSTTKQITRLPSPYLSFSFSHPSIHPFLSSFLHLLSSNFRTQSFLSHHSLTFHQCDVNNCTSPPFYPLPSSLFYFHFKKSRRINARGP